MMILKKATVLVIPVIIFLTGSIKSFSQSSTQNPEPGTLNPNLSTVIKTQALDMGRAMTMGDSKTFSKYILPELLNTTVGSQNGNMLLDSAFNMFKAFGGQVKKITYGNPGKIISYKNELQTTLPQKTEITSPFADVVMSSTLVAISRDNGMNWYFFDTAMGKVGQLKDKLPTLSPDIVVPAPEKPQITPKQ